MQNEMLDKILLAVVNVQEKQRNHDERFNQLEESNDRTYRRIDEFLTLIDRHEAEIAALRAYQVRLEERIEILEKKVGLAV